MEIRARFNCETDAFFYEMDNCGFGMILARKCLFSSKNAISS